MTALNVSWRSLASRFALGLLALLALPLATLGSSASGGELRGRVEVLRDGEPKGNAGNVVVYLKGVPDALPDTSKMVYRVYQHDKQFTPAVSVALLGSTIEFPNTDKIFHNVFSLSKALRFDLGLYKDGESKSVKAKKIGVIDVYCNIHPQMAAKIVVLDTKHYAITETDGKFKLQGIPPGSYELVAWQPHGKELTQRVVVSRGANPELRLKLVEGAESGRHLRKDGTPYGRYE